MEGDSLLNSHPNTQLRMKLATTALREAGIAPALLMTGPDFYVEAAAGASGHVTSKREVVAEQCSEHLK